MGKFIDGMLQMHKNFCDTLLGEEKMREMKMPPLLSEFAKNAPTKDTTYTLEYTKAKKKEGKRISEVHFAKGHVFSEQPMEKSNGTIRYVAPDDEETKKLLAKKTDLENELNRINTRLANKEMEVDLLGKFEEGKWYEYFDCLGMPSIIFKYSKNDFIRDNQLWVHNAFSRTITKMQSSFAHQDIFWIPVNDLEEKVKEIEAVYVHKMIEEEIAQLRGLE